MVSIREAKTKFDILVKDLKKSENELRAQTALNSRKINAITDSIKNKVKILLPDLNSENLAAFNQAAILAGIRESFITTITKLQQQDKAVELQIIELKNQLRPIQPMVDEKTLLIEQEVSLGREFQKTETQISSFEYALRKVFLHNSLYQKKLTPETVHEFKGLPPHIHLWRYLIDPEYRSGYKALNTYEPVDDNFANDLFKLENYKNDKQGQAAKIHQINTAINHLDYEIKRIKEIQKNISELKIKINGPEVILDITRQKIFSAVTNHPKFAENFVRNSKQQNTNFFSFSLNKMEMLRKSNYHLERQIAGIRESIRKLEVPLRKLTTACTKGASYKSINLNLSQIELGINGQNTASRKFAAHAESFRSTVVDFTPPMNIGTDHWNSFMILHLLQNGNDPQFVFSTIETTPQDLRVELENIRANNTIITQPELNTALDNVNTMPNIGNDIDSGGTDFFGSMPNHIDTNPSNFEFSIPTDSTLNSTAFDSLIVDVSLPDISMPSIPDFFIPDTSFSVPDFSMPTDTGTSTFDSGGW